MTIWEPLSKAEVSRVYHATRPKSGDAAADVLFEGPKLFSEALNYPERIKVVYASEPVLDLTLPSHVKCYTVKLREAKGITNLEEFPGISCRMELRYAESVGPDENAVFLYQLQDPGNIGTILRTADWFGVTKVVAYNSVSLFNAKLVQASMGSVLRVGVVRNMQLQELRATHQVYVSDLAGTDIERVQVREPWVLCIGNESRGVQGLDLADAERVTIPRIGTTVDSLNAAVSCGILLDRLRTAPRS